MQENVQKCLLCSLSGMNPMWVITCCQSLQTSSWIKWTWTAEFAYTWVVAVSHEVWAIFLMVIKMSQTGPKSLDVFSVKTAGSIIVVNRQQYSQIQTTRVHSAECCCNW